MASAGKSDSQGTASSVILCQLCETKRKDIHAGNCKNEDTCGVTNMCRTCGTWDEDEEEWECPGCVTKREERGDVYSPHTQKWTKAGSSPDNSQDYRAIDEPTVLNG